VPSLVYRIGFVSFVEFLSGNSGNPSRGEGRDVELGARTSKHIFVFVFGYLLTLLSLFLALLLFFILT